jgi:hypothetical protein
MLGKAGHTYLNCEYRPGERLLTKLSATQELSRGGDVERFQVTTPETGAGGIRDR